MAGSSMKSVTVQYLALCSTAAPPEGCSTKITFPGLVLRVHRGAYVVKALHFVTYVPFDDQNSDRLRSRIYSGASSRSISWPLTKPYEELIMTVNFGGADGSRCKHYFIISVLIHDFVLPSTDSSS
jgi:hypothetical protein